MSDFTNDFWNWYVSIITVVSILACGIFLWKLTSRKLAPGEKPATMGHVWDGDLQEFNNPLPNWWRWLFYITIFRLSISYCIRDSDLLAECSNGVRPANTKTK